MSPGLKLRMVAAHRAGDQVAMRLLSQERQAEKRAKKFSQCSVCGVTIGRGSFYCMMHMILHRYSSNKLAPLSTLNSQLSTS